MARVALSRMMQDRGEPIRAFAARLCGQAEVCRFTKKCVGYDHRASKLLFAKSAHFFSILTAFSVFYTEGYLNYAHFRPSFFSILG